MPELSHDTTEDGFHEIQLSGKQLVFLFIVTTSVVVGVFLFGVLVGRGARDGRRKSRPAPSTTSAAPRLLLRRVRSSAAVEPPAPAQDGPGQAGDSLRRSPDSSGARTRNTEAQIRRDQVVYAQGREARLPPPAQGRGGSSAAGSAGSGSSQRTGREAQAPAPAPAPAGHQRPPTFRRPASPAPGSCRSLPRVSPRLPPPW